MIQHLSSMLVRLSIAMFLFSSCSMELKKHPLTALSQSASGPITATQLVFTTPPSTTGNTDTALAQQPVVTAENGSGQVATGYSLPISLSVYSDTTCSTAVPGALAISSNPVTASSGVASFSGVKIKKTSVRSILATDGTLSKCFNTLTISAGAPVAIVKSSGDAQSGTAGQALASPFVATVTDANGNLVPAATIDWAVASGGGSLSSTSNSTNASGQSSSTLTLGTVAGANSATATIHGTATSVTFNATGTAGAASKLAFTTQPSSSGTAGTTLTQQPMVKVQDASGNTVTGSSASVAIALYSDSGCTTAVTTTPSGAGSLGGTTTVSASSGVVTYAGISVKDAATTLYLGASSGGLTSACSSVMNISPAAFSLSQSTLAVSATTVASGASITTTLTALDAYGNANPSGITGVTFSSTTTAGTGTFGSTTNAGSGVYTVSFTGQTVGLVTLSGLINASAISQTKDVTVVAGLINKLVFTTAPSTTGNTDTALSTQPVVSGEDASNNVVAAYTANITLTAYSDTACSTLVAGGLTATTNPVATSSGVASFAGVKILKTNVQSIKASDGSFSKCFSTLTISAGAPVNIAKTSGDGQTGTVGQALSSAFVATVTDANANVVPSATVDWAVASGGGSLSSASNSTNASGQSSSTLTLGSVAGANSATATIHGTATSVTFNATGTAGAATKLAFTTQPSATGTAGTALSQQPVVKVQDASNNTVTGSSASVALALYSDSGCTTAVSTTPNASGSLGGTTTVAASSGVVTYAGISVNDAATTLYLGASSSGLTSACSSLMNISPGAFSLSQSTLGVSATTVASGSSITTTLTALDAYGNANPSGVTAVTYSSSVVGGTGTFGSTTNAGSGVYTASFTGQVAGLVTLSGLINGSAITPTKNVTVTAGAVSKLVFTTIPSTTGNTDTALSTQPVVSGEDASNNVVSSYAGNITLSAYSDTGCTTSVASGLTATTNPVTASSGVATFAGVKILKTNVQSMKATDGTYSVCLNTFTISAGAPVNIAKTSGDAQSGTIGQALASAFVATVTDANANVVPSATVDWAVASGGGSLSSTSNSTNASGQSSSTLTLGTVAGANSATATIHGTATSVTFNATANPGAAAKLVFTTQPSATGTAGTTLTQQPVVTVEDASNNTVTGSSASVAIALYSDSGCTTAVTTTPSGAGSLGGTTTVSASSGVVTYAGISVKDAASTLYLGASSSGLTSACSSVTNISPAAFSLAQSTLGVSATTVASGSSITVTLTALDTYGNANPSGVTAVTYSSSVVGGTGTFGSTTNAGSGVYTASFTGQVAGLVTLSGLINGSAITPTKNVTVTAGSVSKLVFTTTPSTTGNTDTALSTQPVVSGEDASNNVVTTYAGSVTLSAYSDTGCTTSVASGLTATTNPVTAASGVATFAGVKILKTNVQSIKASDGTYSTCFNTLVISPGVPAAIAVSSGNNQSATHGSTLSPFVAVVTDANANVIPSVQVDWAVASGGGSLSSASNNTDSSGLSSSTLTLGSGLGTNTATATVHGAAYSVTFTATATGTPVTQNWPFDFGSDASYTFNSTLFDFTGGVCRLTGTDQTDDDNAATGFGGGTHTGTTWDGSNTELRLSSTTSNMIGELDSSWAPKYSNIVAYWKFNNSWTDSIGGRTLVPTGTTSFTTSSRLGSHAATFTNGSASYTPDPTDTTLDNSTKNLSITLWFYPTATPGAWAGLVTKGNSQTNTNYDLATWNGTYQIYFTYSDGTNWNDAMSGLNVVPNQWNFVGFTMNNGNITFNVNGVVSTTNKPAAMITSNTPIYINLANNQMNYGNIDEVAIWNTYLSASDLQAIYERQRTAHAGQFMSRVMDALTTGMSWTTLSWIPSLPYLKELPDYNGSIQNETSTSYPSLVGASGNVGDNNLMSGIAGLWHLNETTTGTAPSGTDIADQSGNNNHGTKMGGVTMGQPGKLNLSSSFDGSTGYYNVPDSPTLQVTKITVSAWVKYTLVTAQQWQGIVSKNGSADFIMAVGGTNGAGKAVFYLSGANTTNSGNLLSTSTINDGNWHHLVGTYDGTTARFYVDGVQNASSTTLTGGALHTSTSALTIGAYSTPTKYFSGSIDEVAVWGRSLDPKEVLQLYRRGVNRVKYQVRVCTTPNGGNTDCTDDPTGANWKGPDGTNQTYFSELNNMSVQAAISSGKVLKTSPSMLFSNFTSPVGTSRYFQYRTILESDDTSTSCNYGSGATWCSPEIKSVKVDPVHYTNTSPSVVGKTGVSYLALSSYTETLGASCAGGIGYNLGVGASAAAATWYYWNGSAWTTADGTATQSNSASVINSNLGTFATQVGTGTVYFKAYLKSNGAQACELDNVALGVLQ